MSWTDQIVWAARCPRPAPDSCHIRLNRDALSRTWRRQPLSTADEEPVIQKGRRQQARCSFYTPPLRGRGIGAARIPTGCEYSVKISNPEGKVQKHGFSLQMLFCSASEVSELCF